jgi:hypothetical protein
MALANEIGLPKLVIPKMNREACRICHPSGGP